MRGQFWRRSYGPKPHKHSWQSFTMDETSNYRKWQRHHREYRECRTCGALETKVEWWRDWSGKTYWENPS